jgi:hypothetical protein
MTDSIVEQDDADRLADNLRILRKISDEIEGWEKALTPPTQAAGNDAEHSSDAAGRVA